MIRIVLRNGKRMLLREKSKEICKERYKEPIKSYLEHVSAVKNYKKQSNHNEDSVKLINDDIFYFIINYKKVYV
jgi:hypothetical protein